MHTTWSTKVVFSLMTVKNGWISLGSVKHGSTSKHISTKPPKIVIATTHSQARWLLLHNQPEQCIKVPVDQGTLHAATKDFMKLDVCHVKERTALSTLLELQVQLLQMINDWCDEIKTMK